MTRIGGGFEKCYLGNALAGEGGVVSTVDDMLRWLSQVESLPAWSSLCEPQRLTDGSSTCYGLGLRSYRYRGLHMFGHTGGLMGGHAQMLKVPSARLDVVILANRQDVEVQKLAEKIVDACVPEIEAGAPGSLADLPAKGLLESALEGQAVASEGCYRAESHDIQVSIRGTIMRTRGRYGAAEYNLTGCRALATGMMPWAAALRFSDSADRLWVTTARTWELPFRPVQHAD